MRTVRLSVVVPFFNEEEDLGRYPEELVAPIEALGLDWELILVDDGSQDRSLETARALSACFPRVKVLSHPKNRGLGAALRTGIAASLGEMVATLDADLTFHPRLLQVLVQRFLEEDVALELGSPALSGYGPQVPRHRVALSRAANLLYQLALGARLTAVTPIFRLYRGQALRGLKLDSERFEINAEILAKLLFRGARVAEVPAALTTRIHGVSKLDNLQEIRNHLRLLGKILWWRL